MTDTLADHQIKVQKQAEEGRGFIGNVSQQCNEDVLTAKIIEDIKMWIAAGAGAGDLLI